MKRMPEELRTDVEALMAKHNVDNLDKANFLGQLASTMDGIYVQNTIKWLPGGMAYGYATKHDVIGTLKRITEKTSEPLVFNDDDCNLQGYTIEIFHDCMDCKDSLVTRMLERKLVKTEDCTRCNHTGIDPYHIHHAWVLHHGNHGHDTVYIVIENSISTELHIRSFKYNSSNAKIKAGINEIIEVIKTDDREIKSCPMLVYKDNRDKGFCLSMDSREDGHHTTEANDQGMHYLTDIAEHFTAIEKELIS